MSDSRHSPYLDARREWNERYGSYIAAARSWRRAAFGSLAIAGLCAGGLVYVGGTHEWVPYVVEVREGAVANVQSLRPAERTGPLDRRLVRAQLAQFIQDIRAVSIDDAVQRQAIKRTFAHVSPEHAAHTSLKAHFSAHSPLKRAQEETVTVEIAQVLPLTAGTWRIEWTERAWSRSGEALPATHWIGTAVVVRGAVDEHLVFLNPLGLFVKEFTWAQDFTANS